MLNLGGESSEEDEDLPLSLPSRKRDHAGSILPVSVDKDKIRSNSLVLLDKNNDVDEDYDEPIEERQISEIVLSKESYSDAKFNSSVLPMNIIKDDDGLNIAPISAEFSEASTAISADIWDVSSWIVYLQEIENGKGGSVSVVDAYRRFLIYFPRAAVFWKKLAEYYEKHQDIVACEQTLAEGSEKCWNVELWAYYLSWLAVQFRQIESSKSTPEEVILAQKKVETAFENSISCIGMSVDSFSIWKAYLDFAKLLPESVHLDIAKKISLLRSIYRKALCVPFDQADVIWNDYEAFERAHNESSAERVLEDMKKKFLHSKSILKERRRFFDRVDFGRLSVPATNSQSELVQLEAWSQWIAYELSCPDYVNQEMLLPTVRMVFQQCISTYLYFPEVWLSFSKFETQFSDISVARNILHQGIQANQDSALLKIALSELEEVQGNIDVAREILRAMFESSPDGFKFALYQRFVHRNVGLISARRLFSETSTLRANDNQLALELFLAHALTELEVNCLPQVALNILIFTKKQLPNCVGNYSYLRLLVRLLIQLGDVKQIRWLLQTALEGLNAEQFVSSGEDAKNLTAASVGNNNKGMLKLQFDLMELFISAETALGTRDLKHLHNLRDLRHKVRLQLDDTDKARGVSMQSTARDDYKATRHGLFDVAHEILERYEGCILEGTLPESDEEVRERCRGKFSTSEEIVGVRKDARLERDREKERQKDISSGLSAALRDLIARLPPISGIAPDPDVFIRHMRNVILPPRPIPDTTNFDQDINEDRDDGGMSDANLMQENDEDDTCDGNNNIDAEEDIFRKRQRLHLMTKEEEERN